MARQHLLEPVDRVETSDAKRLRQRLTEQQYAMRLGLVERQQLAARLSELDLCRRTARANEQALGDTIAHAREAFQRKQAETATHAEILELLEAERNTLSQRVSDLVALKDGLDRECTQLRQRAAAGEDPERHRTEVAHLRSKLQEVEEQYREAVQRHSGAVSGYMVELNQRSDIVRQRDVELQRLKEQLTALQEAYDKSSAQLAEGRQERELLELRIRELESARAMSSGNLTGRAPTPPQPAVSPEHAAALPPRVTAPPGNEAHTATATARKRETPAAGAGDPITLIHFEDQAPFREAIRTAMAADGYVRYLTGEEATSDKVSGRAILLVNLVSHGADALATITASTQWGIKEPRAFVYCAAGGRGFALGMVDCFPTPLNTDNCATGLLERTNRLQRLLAVSDDVDWITLLREILLRSRCSTSMAFDRRQACDLVPMVRPDLVLIDCAVQSRDGLALAGRLRLDPRTAALPIGLMWTKPIDPVNFRQQALRAASSFPFTHHDLVSALRRSLNLGDVGTVPAPLALQTA